MRTPLVMHDQSDRAFATGIALTSDIETGGRPNEAEHGLRVGER